MPMIWPLSLLPDQISERTYRWPVSSGSFLPASHFHGFGPSGQTAASPSSVLCGGDMLTPAGSKIQAGGKLAYCHILPESSTLEVKALVQPMAERILISQ